MCRPWGKLCAHTLPRVWIFNLWNLPPMFILEIFIITMFGDGSLIYEHKHMRLYSYRRLCIKMTRFRLKTVKRLAHIMVHSICFGNIFVAPHTQFTLSSYIIVKFCIMPMTKVLVMTLAIVSCTNFCDPSKNFWKISKNDVLRAVRVFCIRWGPTPGPWVYSHL